ncbi:hypothetical protein BWO91_01140 [Plantibacter flavus]|nr:hypothetical protein BWO91_01140 [Plantibacter flavus]
MSSAPAARRSGHRRDDPLRGHPARHPRGARVHGHPRQAHRLHPAGADVEPRPAFTIGSQLVEPLRVTLGLSKKEATDKALALLERVGIPNPKRTFAAFPHEVSGGMAQRVLIAGAVSTDPDIIIADEPTTALDVTVQAEVLDLLRDLQAERDAPRDAQLRVVADLCDRVSVMQNGLIVRPGRCARSSTTRSTVHAVAARRDPRRGSRRPALATNLTGETR